MQPDSVASFMTAYSTATNAHNGAQEAKRARLQSERDATARKLDGLYDAIAEGLRRPGLQAKLSDMEQRIKELDREIAAPPPSPVRLHPNLSEIYRRKV
ncbi:hypothetical protein [Pontibaca salina]|uniref:Uncharacterized protein n=1 Tax=Pontibaca salina TaxID=2795731 RepID=A0A934HUB7_9RHOB|nr:hypothetical protein [Pontibaca salina]MBI6630383.1 hypothetical protein [Pontibaca salina]